MPPIIQHLDKIVILRAKGMSFVAMRLALFVIYFWFGILKVMGYSPAGPLVDALLAETFPIIAPHFFMTIFGMHEMVIGILFLFPKLDRLTIPLLFLHMITTFGPMVLLPEIAWAGWFIPTLEGQYIIKNLAIIALAIGLIGHLRPLEKEEAKSLMPVPSKKRK